MEPFRLKTYARCVASEDLQQRLIAAAFECAVSYGLGKTSLTDVATRAGVSRATVYRVFGSKRGLVEQAAAEEMRRHLAEVDRELESLPANASLEDHMAHCVDISLSFWQGHAVLQRMLREEPAELIDVIYERPGHEMLSHSVMTAYLAPRIAEHPEAARLAVTPQQAADMMVRLVHTFIVSPDATLGNGRALARLCLRGLFATGTSPGHAATALPDSERAAH
jgi:AcrR family transcriptional regulator